MRQENQEPKKSDDEEEDGGLKGFNTFVPIITFIVTSISYGSIATGLGLAILMWISVFIIRILHMVNNKK